MNADAVLLAVPVGPADHIQGPDDAPITLVEYGDYECPYCGAAFPIVKGLQQTFGESLRFVFRNFPLAEVHPHAEIAAEMAEAVGFQGKFWPMHDLLYLNQDDLEEPALLRYAQKAGADVGEAARAIASGVARRRVLADVEGGLRSGVTGTPTFYVNGVRYERSFEFDPFREFLRTVLRSVTAA